MWFVCCLFVPYALLRVLDPYYNSKIPLCGYFFAYCLHLFFICFMFYCFLIVNLHKQSNYNWCNCIIYYSLLFLCFYVFVISFNFIPTLLFLFCFGYENAIHFQLCFYIDCIFIPTLLFLFYFGCKNTIHFQLCFCS